MTNRLKNDYNYNSLRLTDNLYIPLVNITTKPVGAEGDIVYNLPDNTIYYSDGLNWLPITGGSVTNAANVGGGAELFRDKIGTILNFRTLLAGTGISVVQAANTVTINSAGGDTNTFGVITGDGSLGDPVRVIDGTADKQILQWDAGTASWGLQTGAENLIYVDAVFGNDATGEANNPNRAFQTLGAGLTAGLAILPVTIEVRPGTYTNANNLARDQVTWNFEGGVVVNSSVTIFNITGADPPLTEFRVYGRADFRAGFGGAFSRVISFSNGASRAYIEALAMSSTTSDAIFLDVISDISIYVETDITSTSAFGMHLRTGTGYIECENITGVTRGVEMRNANGNWDVYARQTITATTASAVRIASSSHNDRVYADNIFSNVAEAITASDGNLIIEGRRVFSNVTNAIIASGGVDITIRNLDEIITGAALTHALSLTGTNDVTIFCRLIEGISINSASSVNLNVFCTNITSSTDISAIATAGTGGYNIRVNCLDITGDDNNTLDLQGTGGQNISINCMTITGSGTGFSPVRVNNSLINLFLNVDNIIAFVNGTSAIAIEAGVVRGYVKRLGASSATTNAINVAGNNSSLYLTNDTCICTAECVSIPSGSPIVHLSSKFMTSSGAEVISIVGTPTDFHLHDTYARCLFNNASGHGLLVTNNTSIIKLQNCAFFITNAGAFSLFSSVAATNIRIYSTFSSNNAVNANVTTTVGVVTIDAVNFI